MDWMRLTAHLRALDFDSTESDHFWHFDRYHLVQNIPGMGGNVSRVGALIRDGRKRLKLDQSTLAKTHRHHPPRTTRQE